MKKLLILFMILLTITLHAFDKKNVFYVLSDTEVSKVGNIITLSGHSDSICSVAYSPNGKYLASGSLDKTIKIWDIANGKILTTLIGHSDSVYSVAFSPDGKYLASGSLDKTIKIWDIANGEEIKTLTGHNDSICSIDFSSDGKYLASGSDDKTIRIWDISSGEEIETLIGHNESVYSVAFSPDRKHLASGSLDKTIKIWDIANGEEIETLTGHSNFVYSVAFSPDGKYLVSGSLDRTIKIWDIANGEEIKTLIGHNNFVYSVAYSPNGKYIASSSGDKTIKIWDIANGEEIKTLTGHNNFVYSVAFSPDGKYLASGSFDKTIKIWKNLETEGSYKTIKTRVKIKTNIKNETGEIIGILPQNVVSDISLVNNKIFKPLKGFINTGDFELLYNNESNVKFYTLVNTPLYIDSEKTKVLTNMPKGKIVDKLYYSFELDMYYIENGNTKGWIESENIELLEKKSNKFAIINNNTDVYNSINGLRKNTYNSGDILDTDFVDSENGYFYSDNIGWINKNDVMLINEDNKNRRIFTSLNEVKFNSDFTGSNYKNVAIGTEYRLLGTTEKYNLVESIATKEKGWILKSDVSFTKPDLNDPVIVITSTNIDENNMLTISGKIYDDTAINSLLLNGNKISTKALTTFDKLSYTPEVGYSFTSQWFLVEGMENNVEIKVVDRDGKSYSKVLQYTPELKTINLNEFQIENIVTKLPKLEYSMELKDDNSDGVLSGSEKMNLVVKVVNTGDGDAKNVNLKVNGTNPNLQYNNIYPLGTVKPYETKIAVIEIKGKDDNISLIKSNFDLAIEEANGFNPFPAKFSFNTEPKLNPKLEILDYAIDDENKNGQIEQGEKFDLYVLVQNTGEGESKNTILEVNKKAEGIIPMAETSYKFDSLKSGESKKMKFSFVTNYLYKESGDLPFDINLYNEKNAVKDNKSITLTMNKVMPTIKEINLEAKKKAVVVASKISLMSDIDDTSKLVITAPNLKKWAVVIGVENYKKAPDVEFAERDALVTKEYFNKLLGVPKENTFYLANSDATKTELETLLTSTLKNRVGKDDEVYFYFSGHGVPTNEGDSYLLLNDSDPATPQISAYSVKRLYEDLGSLKTLKSYAFLDTCFSGQVARGNEKDSLLSGTRAVMKVKDITLAYNNLTVYAATGKDQLSNSFKEQGHGLFTYYMLKGLGGEADTNKDGKVSEQELQDYIKSNVSTQSRKLYGESRYQEPMLKSMVDGDIY